MMTIRILREEDLEKGQAFLFEMVETLFHRERDPKVHKDIFEMLTFYFQTEEHVLIGAFDSQERLVGTIALKGFIDRFESFKGRYSLATAEVGRCYIKSEFRRKGLGTQLLAEAVTQARRIGYETLYLHTHPHLPGGYDFWLKSGFEVFMRDATTPETIHMELQL